MHRFFVGERDTIGGDMAVIRDAELRHQWVRVLRLRVGEHVVLLQGDGYEYEMEILAFERGEVRLRVIECRRPNTELPFRLMLAMSFLKSVDKFEIVLQKGTELGVGAFLPMVTSRTEKRMVAKTPRWNKILKEAAEQSGRLIIPELLLPVSFEEVIRHEGTLLIPDLSSSRSISTALASRRNYPKDVFCVIGPEGGFTSEEIARAHESGANIVSLGSRILRAETAAIISVAFIGQHYS